MEVRLGMDNKVCIEKSASLPSGSGQKLFVPRFGKWIIPQGRFEPRPAPGSALLFFLFFSFHREEFLAVISDFNYSRTHIRISLVHMCIEAFDLSSSRFRYDFKTFTPKAFQRILVVENFQIFNEQA